MKRLMYIILTALISTSAMSAQTIWSLQYSMGIPHGESKQFTDNMSFTGLEITGKTFINENIALGGYLGWNVFSESVSDASLKFGGAEIHGKQYRYLDAAPIMATASYYPTVKEGCKLKPFVSFGIGTIYQDNTIEVGTDSFYSDGWMFGLSPEAGISYTINEKLDFLASYRYLHGFETSQVDALSYSNINFGFSFKL